MSNVTVIDEVHEFVPGDVAWMLTSTALVLFMTIPGLALFYGGMVREKNVLASIMQTFSITCLITFLWLFIGYSIAFGPVNADFTTNAYPLFGDGSQFWLKGMSPMSYHFLAPSIPEALFCMYQLTFAIITAALICGSFADRMKFWPMLVFMTIWHLVVYCPIAHAVWHPDGFLFKAGAIDYAGGNVVHIASGISGLVATIVVGKRKGFGKENFEPHNILLTAVGASMLWVGWFGFNAGSAVAANHRAAYAMLSTHISAAVAALSWMFTETIFKKKPSLLGMVSGAVAGLVGITPGSGFVNPTGAFVIGLLAGPICYGGAQLKHYAGYDDALDAFGVHAIGGIYGGLMAAFFATNDVVGNVAPLPAINGVFYGPEGGAQLAANIYAILFAIAWASVLSFVLLKLIDMTMGLRVSEAEEEAGLDESLHGEKLGEKSLHLVKGQSEASSIQQMLADNKLEKAIELKVDEVKITSV